MPNNDGCQACPYWNDIGEDPHNYGQITQLECFGPHWYDGYRRNGCSNGYTYHTGTPQVEHQWELGRQRYAALGLDISTTQEERAEVRRRENAKQWEDLPDDED